MNLKKLKDNKKSAVAVLSIVIICVMLLPAFYSLMYLGSIWDVYGKLDKVPVAFVNMDRSVTKDGKEYAIGKKLEDGLRDNNKVGWRFVSRQEAIDGVKNEKYYAVVEIPENFSLDIANVQDGKINNPEIIYIANKGRNFVFSQVSSKVADSIKNEISSNIQKEISKSLVDSLLDVKVSIKTAGDGTSELQAGTKKLLDGSRQLVSGTQSAANGSAQLESGLKTAADSTAKLQTGTEKLLQGSNDISNGLNTAAGGTNQLLDGMKKLTNGESQIVYGANALVDGLKTLKSGLTQTNTQLPKLVEGASELNTNTGAIAKGAGQLDTSVSALADAINTADSSLHDTNLSDAQKLNAAIAILDKISKEAVGPNGESRLTLAKASTHQLALSLQGLQTVGTQPISDGVRSLASGLADTQTKAGAGLDKLIVGAQGIQGGSSDILTGLNTATDKTGSLANGLQQLSNGSAALTAGLNTVNDGNLNLEKGLYTAADKTGELSDGLNKLSSGVGTLSDGLNSANEGVIKLNDGLSSGYNQMNDKLKFNSEDMSKFISNPVTLNDNSINSVAYYGEGLAPYFMSLSLWIGSMVFSMVFSFIKKRIEFKSKFMNSYIGNFLAGSVMPVMQTIILCFAAIKLLGVNPASSFQFYFTNIIIAITFFSIFYAVTDLIGIAGSAVMFVILLLQLSSSGGTFPIETAPVFYRVVNNIVPMTYSVSTLRMTISGINQSVLNQNMIIMFVFILAFLGGGFVIKSASDFLKKKKMIKNSKAA